MRRLWDDRNFYLQFSFLGDMSKASKLRLLISPALAVEKGTWIPQRDKQDVCIF